MSKPLRLETGRSTQSETTLKLREIRPMVTKVHDSRRRAEKGRGRKRPDTGMAVHYEYRGKRYHDGGGGVRMLGVAGIGYEETTP